MSNFTNPNFSQPNLQFGQQPFDQMNTTGKPPFTDQQPFQQPFQQFQQPFQQFQQPPLFPTPTPGFPLIEQSYIENILRLNIGKLATVYMNFENSQWGSQVFKGIVEAAGKDHIILSDPNTGVRYLLLMIYLNYITFDEEINYEYPFSVRPPQEQTQAPIFNMPFQPQPGFPGQQTQFRKKDSNSEE